MRTRTHIVATIGPASATLVPELVRAGMDAARINFSHGTQESNGAYIDAIRAASAQANIPIPVILDLSGPRSQTESGHTFNAGAKAITDKDRDDVVFGISKGVEYVALSYVQRAEDVAALRTLLRDARSTAKIIAKIERPEALDAIDAIVAAADAIMIARGDLGDAIPAEELPFVERLLITRAHEAEKPAIVATEMLYSMVQNTRPTRAEVTDVAYAIMCGADAIMLSDETAKGTHPVEAVAAMERIASFAESETHTTNLRAL